MELVGAYAPEEIVRTFDDVLRDPKLPEHAQFLLDVSGSEVMAQRSAEELRRVANVFGIHAQRFGGRCAVVVSSPVQFGLSRMAGAYVESDSVTIEVFDSPTEALAWLASG